MQKEQSATLAAFTQVRSFLDEHEALFQPINATGARTTLNQVITNLETNAAEQNAHFRASKGARARSIAARKTLLEQNMRTIAGAAQLLVKTIPDLAGITAPASRARISVLLAAADGMVQSAERHRNALNSVLDPGFMDRFKVVIQDMKDAIAFGRTSRTKRSASTAVLRSEVRRGRRAVRVLDGLVLGVLAGDVKLTREWRARRKVLTPGAMRSESQEPGADTAAVAELTQQPV